LPKLLTYGCSFTDYDWSTWANILAKNFNYKLEQKGRQGCGNNFIAYRIKEDIQDKLITSADRVRIMWCYFNRISDIKGPHTFSSIPETHNPIKKEKNARDNCKIIIETEKILLDNGIDYDFLSWLPLPKNSDKFLKEKLVKTIKPPVYTVVFKDSWMSRTDRAIRIDNETPKLLTKRLYQFAKQKNISIIELIRNHSPHHKLEPFYDLHPTPLHHLEYLQSIYPDLSWDPELIAEINRENQEVLSKVW